MHQLQELVRLHRAGCGCREVARLVGISPNTERTYRHALEAADLLQGPPDALPPLETLRAALGPKARPQEVSSVERWRPVIESRLEAGAGPKAIFDWLRVHEPDFKGSYWAVKRWCRRWQDRRGPTPEDVAIPVHTAPGQVAQVDFGYCGWLVDPKSGKSRRAWVFVMVLAHRRHFFAQVVFDQKLTTWVRLHVEAFHFFGGVPQVLVPDNLKAAVTRAAFGLGDNPSLNRTYRELARHFRFRVDPTPPYAPTKKGKVERAIKYVKQSFFAAWQPESLPEANEQLARWNREVASVRTHGATRRVPIEVFEGEEAPALQGLPIEPYDLILWKEAKVHRDSH